MEELKIERLTDEHLNQVLASITKLGAGDRLVEIVKTLISDQGVLKNNKGEEDALNAICVFESKVKGIGAMMDDPIFTLYELDCHEVKLHLTKTLIGGIIDRKRDIDAYNKGRRFAKDRITCIIPITENGWREYESCSEFVINLSNPDALTSEIPEEYQPPTANSKELINKVSDIANQTELDRSGWINKTAAQQGIFD